MSGAMRFDVAQDWAWADQKFHIYQIEEILKHNAIHLIKFEIAPIDKDLKQATDLIVKASGGDIAVRIRRSAYTGIYRDLTIRSWRSSGTETELDKIKKGFCKWYLYAWADKFEVIKDWIFVDLDLLRLSGLINQYQTISNHDQKTGFIAIPSTELKNYKCIISEATKPYYPILNT